MVEVREEEGEGEKVGGEIATNLQAFSFWEFPMQFEPPAAQRPDKRFKQRVPHILDVADIPIIVTWQDETRQVKGQ